MFRFIVVFLLFLAPIFAKPLVVVSILPQQYIVDKISGGTLDVLVMAGVGTNHEVYEPKPSQMKALSGADIYFLIGLPFENIWLDRFKSASANMKIADMGFGIEKIEFEDSHHDEHDHDDEFDWHIWLDPVLLKTQALNVLNALAEKYPNSSDFYKQNYEVLIKELDKLDMTIENRLTKVTNRNFLVFHPSFGYFAKRYGLEQISVEFEGKEPKAKELIEVIEKIKAKKIKALLIEPQVSKKSALSIAKETGISIVEIDPLKKDIPLTLNELADTLLGL